MRALLVLGALALATTMTSRPTAAEQASQIGDVVFPTSCSEAAQAGFERGVALLHSFWFGPARQAFTAATDQDPTCAMGYWGIAMTWLDKPLLGAPPPPAAMAAGWGAVWQALEIGALLPPAGRPGVPRRERPTQRERDYVAAVAIMFRDPEVVDHRGRVLAYEAAMEQLYRDYPEDREAAIFYGLALNMTALPGDYTNAQRGAAILEEVFAVQPEHPGVTHYIIHSYDYPPIAPQGLGAAFRYADLAPAVPHAQHMPSHIFTRVGYWQESIESNQGAIAASWAAAGATLEQIQRDALHPMDYQLYAYLQLGQDAAAGQIVQEIMALEQVLAAPVPAYALAAIPARWPLERGRWADAARLSVHPAEFSWERFPQAEAVTHFAQGVGAARSGDPAGARRAAERLWELSQTLTSIDQAYWADQVSIQQQVVQAWAARADGRNDEALELMRGAAQREDATDKHIVTPGPIVPARELLGEMLLDLGRHAEALQAFEASRQVEPNRFRGLLGAARAARLAGDAQRARAYFGELLALAAASDGDRPELEEARAFLALR